jgi:hypothetical protein
MENVGAAAIVTALFFVVIYVTGFWLSRSPRPLGGGRLNGHKLIALAAGVFVVVTVYRASQVAALSAVETAVVVVAGLLFLGTGITGGLVSIDRPMPPIVKTLHHLTPHLTVLASAAALCLLLGRK